MLYNTFSDYVLVESAPDLVAPVKQNLIDNLINGTKFHEDVGSYYDDPSGGNWDSWFKYYETFKQYATPELEAWIVSALQKYFSEVLKQSLIAKEYLYIKHIWPVAVEPPDHVPLHIHKSGGHPIISAALCINSGDYHSIYFHSTRVLCEEPYAQNDGVVNSHHRVIPVKEGDLVIWNSLFPHEIRKSADPTPLLFVGMDIYIHRPQPPENCIIKILS